MIKIGMTIFRISDPEKIFAIMKECDYAFPESILYREDFPVVFEKIKNQADFLAAYLTEKNSCIGYAAVYANDYDNQTAYITLFCIKPEKQRMNYGTKLIDKCCDLAKESGMKKIRLEVRRENIRAIRFYTYNGFSAECSAGKDSLYMMKQIL